MRILFLTLTLFFAQLAAFNQCNVITTANSIPATCSNSCNGSITYLYQNVAAPGAPYVVYLYDSSGSLVSIQTFIAEFATVFFSNLCADTYEIVIQGQSCNNNLSIVVTAPTPISISLSEMDPSPGMNNGSVTINSSGGTPGYTYSLDGLTYQGSNTFTGLAAGSYTAYVMDSNGCIETSTFILSSAIPCDVVATANALPIPCYGSCAGTINYAYFDGTPSGPYLIQLLLNGNVIQNATNNSPNGTGLFPNVCAGVYTVLVTDVNGCIGQYSVTVTEPPQLNITSITTGNATAGNNDGTVTVNATGGTPSYTYSLDNLTYQANANFTGLAAGVYIAYVKDQNGCVSYYTFIIQTNPGCFFNLSAYLANPVSCAGACDAELNYVFAGSPSDPIFTIVLESNGNTIQTLTSLNQTNTGQFTNLCAGVYTITVTNASGCSEVFTITIPNATPLTVTAIPTNPTAGSNNGQITVGVAGGTAPYLYSLDYGTTFQPSNVFTGLAAGVYVVYVQDANGCVGIYTVELQNAGTCDFFLVTSLVQPISCYGACDAVIFYSFNDIGNHPPYLIQLLQGSTIVQTTTTSASGGSGSFVNLCAGIYTVKFTDANGCVDTEVVYVTNPPQLTVTSATTSNATAGNSDGLATINASGGTTPYQFSIDNGATWQASNVFSNLSAGIYVAHVQDANGCSSIFTFIIDEDPGCFINTTIFPANAISCYGACDGELNFAYVDGALNGPYTITLSNNSGVISANTSNLSSFSGTFTNLCAGNYSLVVTDASGCGSFVVNYTLTQPAQLTATASTTNASVGNSNGSATINASGGTAAYVYSLDGITWQPSNTFTGLAAGVYIAYVQDANGCSTMHTFVITETASCNIVVTAFQSQSVTCAGACDGQLGFAFNDVNTNPPYLVTLTSTGGSTQVQTFATSNAGSGVFTNLCPGVYVVTVQDANGCTSSYTTQIFGPSFLSIAVNTVDATAGNSDGFVTVTATGGTPPYQYSMDNGTTWQASNTFTGLGAGVYVVFVQDANGCMQLLTFILGDSNTLSIVSSEMEFFVYPNPTTGIVWLQSTSVENCVIYDVSGKIISAPINKLDNGFTVDLTSLADGMYILEIMDNSGLVGRKTVIKN